MRSSGALVALAVLPALSLAASSFDDAIGAVSPREWLWIAGLATFGGLASLLQRLDASQRAVDARANGRPYNEKAIIIASKPLFVAAHMVGAIFTGVLFYFLLSGQTYVTNGPAMIAMILAVAYSGAQAAERGAAGYFRILRLLREQDPGEAKK